MADDIEKSYDIGLDGLGFRDNSNEELKIWVGAGDTDPSQSPGIVAPIGSKYLSTDGNLYEKKAALDTDWIVQTQEIQNNLVPPILCQHNGTLSDGQLVGYSNLVNNPIVIGFRSQLARVSYINSRANADADFRFYRNSETPGNLFATESVSNLTNTVFIISNSPVFEINDTLQIYYDNTGTNPSDLSLGLFFKAVF